MEESKKARSGPITAVPCPWCGKKNNHAEITPESAGRQTYKKTDFKIECDHCAHSYIIMRSQLVVTVVQYHPDE